MRIRVHKIASVVYRAGFEKELEITDQLEVSLLAWVADHDSNVAAFDYDRVIGGSYLTYRF